jgi:YegS/Rv2252/BmrU family lipid kinase
VKWKFLMRYLVILNPTAASGNAGRMAPKIYTELKTHGLDFDLVLTERPWHAAELASEASRKGYDCVVAAGGDGTINEVINGMMRQKPTGHDDICLGVLPVGGGNDFAFGMGLPTDFKAGLETLVNGTCRPIDIGRITGGLYPQGRFFGNGVGIGYDAKVSFSIQRSSLRGFLGYLVASLVTLFFEFTPPTVEIEMSQKTITQPSMMVSIMNGRRMGGGFIMTPTAQPNDGTFDLCIAKKVRKDVILRLIPRFMAGNQAGHPAIHFEQSDRVRVKAIEGTLPVHADGETITREGQEVSIDLIPAAIQLISPTPAFHHGDSQ